MRQSQYLETDRLVLEPIEARHASLLWKPLRNTKLYRYIPRDPPTSLEELECRFKRLSHGKSADGSQTWHNWVMRLRDYLEPVGMLEATIRRDETAVIAYCTFPRYWRRGFATEGCKAMIQYLFDRYSMDKLDALIDTRNAASIALVEKLGFVHVATIYNADFFKGSKSDEYRYTLSNPAQGV